MNTNEKLLELAYKIDAEGGTHGGSYAELIQALKDNIQELDAKKAGTAKPLKIIKKMLKSNQKNYINKFLGYIKLDSNRFAFLDGHRVFISNSDLGFSEDENAAGLANTLKRALEHGNATEEIEISLTEVKEQLARNKANKDKLHPLIKQLEGYKIGLNPEYLKDCFEFSGSLKFIYEKRVNVHGCNVSPLFQIDDAGDVCTMVLPVNIN